MLAGRRSLAAQPWARILRASPRTPISRFTAPFSSSSFSSSSSSSSSSSRSRWWARPSTMAGAGATLALLTAASSTAASCDPVEALHAMWTYMTVERREQKMRKEMKDEILRVREEFKLRNMDVDGLYERFDRFARTKHGRIFRNELVLALQDMGVTDPIIAEAIFSFFDTDHTGSIDFHEFAVGISIFSHGSAAQKAGFMFHLCDRNGSGSIDRTELRTTIKTLLSLHSRLQVPVVLPTPLGDLLEGIDEKAHQQITANFLAREILREARGSPDGTIDHKSFDAWVAGHTPAARIFVALFDRLEHQFVPSERPHAAPAPKAKAIFHVPEMDAIPPEPK